MKHIKSIWVLLFVVVLTMSYAACSSAPTDVATPNLRTVVIYADFSNGSEDPVSDELIKEDVFEIETELTINDLATALSKWSGLDFKIKDARIEGSSAYVDWTEDSTLVAGLDDRKQKEAFFFFDSDSLNWFMMDSLARTINGNFSI
jgi:hypothetical protein